MFWTWEFWTQTFREPTTFWAMAAAASTVAIAIVAYKQLRDLAQTSRSDFLYRLKKDFFTDDARKLMLLVDNDLLELCKEDIPYFRVVATEDPEIKERLAELGIQSPTISAYLVEDVLLGPLEDLGVLERLNRVSIEEVYEHFVAYVTSCAENTAIRDYLRWSADDEDDDVYDHFLGLYEKLVKEGPEIRKEKRKHGVKSTRTALAE